MDWMQVVPQIITAGATLGGIVLTLVITGRRENKRTSQQLQWEREKNEQSRIEAQQNRLHDQRVQALTRFLDVCVDPHCKTGSYKRRSEGDAERRAEIYKLREFVRETGFPVVLLAPNIRDVVNEVRGLMNEPRIFKKEPLRPGWRAEANEALRTMTRAMSVELGIEVPSLEVHNREKLTEAP